MVLKITSLTLLVLVLGLVQSSDLPVEKCNLTDKACMIPAFQKMVPIFLGGMPQYGIEVLDPMAMDDLKYDIKGLQFSLIGGTMKGLKDSVIDNVDWDTEKKVFTIDFHTDAFVTGPYTAAGKVAHLPISGEGIFKLNMKILNVKLVINFDMVNNGGKDHVKLTGNSYEFDIKDHAEFDLSNLYNGDKARSDEMIKFLNDNWKQITDDFGRPMMNIAVNQIFKNMGVFFEKLSIAEIANV